jgi:glycerol-3-phosphate acyltransferase PlsX
MSTTIAIDAMGGDYGPSVTVPAAIRFLRQADNQDIRVILVGIKDQIHQAVKEQNGDVFIVNQKLIIHHASEVVGMDEPPASALKKKKDSSMRVSIDLVKQGAASAAVSAGNTGALMATARFVLKMIPGINRPAICTQLPCKDRKHNVYMLDLGANVDSTPETLLQFATMGSVLAELSESTKKPRIGLLNVGEEDIKGNEKVKSAAKLISDSDLNYIGYVEGDELYDNKAHVIVCDGFEGNIALKTSEGTAAFIAQTLSEEFKRNIFTKLLGLFALPVINAVKKRLDPRIYNGATLIGLNGTVIKSHGGTDDVGFFHAINEAAKEARLNLTSHIAKEIEKI